MAYGPPPEQNAYPAPQHPQQPGPHYPQQPAPQYPQPQYPQQPQAQQQPWTDPHGRTWPGGPPPAPRPKSSGLAVVALLLGLAGLVCPFLPMNLDRIREYVAFPFALPGLALAVVACIGPRRGKPVAVIAWMLSFLALAVGAIMVFNYHFR